MYTDETEKYFTFTEQARRGQARYEFAFDPYWDDKEHHCGSAWLCNGGVLAYTLRAGGLRWRIGVN